MATRIFNFGARGPANAQSFVGCEHMDENYIIRFPNGLFYTGRAGHGYMGPREEAFKFTKEGGLNKIARLGKTSMMWRDAKVVPAKETS